MHHGRNYDIPDDIWAELMKTVRIIEVLKPKPKVQLVTMAPHPAVTPIPVTFTLDSREVARMTDKAHKDLLRDVRNYAQILTGANLRPSNFFTPSSYTDAKGEVRPCYNITRKGCELIANKMTGQKGVLFSAAYITRFHEMEQALARPVPAPRTLSEVFRLAADMMEQQQMPG